MNDLSPSMQAQAELDKAVQNEKWLMENASRIRGVIDSERAMYRRSMEQYLQLEKMKYASRAISIGHLEPCVVKEIFSLTDKEVGEL